ncbi:MAG: sugar-transfer associated ATP-grasp domain-containing protein [Bacteroidota bacterium]
MKKLIKTILMFKNIFKNSLYNNFQAMGINERNVSLIYPNNQRKHYKLADDKVLTKNILETYNIPCAKTYAVIERIGDIIPKWKSIQQYEKIAVKPANGSGGGGIQILTQKADGWYKSGELYPEEEIFTHMANIIMGCFSLGSDDRVLIEACIEPHPFFHEIYPEGVPDFRVILLKGKPIISMLRIPTDISNGKANLHQGGLGIGIDMQKGELLQAHDGKNYHNIHPDNGNQIKGKKIPHWEAILEISKKTAAHFPLQYLGIDIVIDKDLGPLIMEINVRPGLGIQMANKVGMKGVLRN